MFTGLVEGMAQIAASDFDGVGLRLTLDLRELSQGVRIGDSICVSGCCLTVIAIDASLCTFELGSETLSKTKFLSLKPNAYVNIERSLRVGDRVGGHFVTGHVDGLGELQHRRDDREWAHFYFLASKSLLRQMVPKGSITIDGVSLTVVDATDEMFSIALIPHTLEVTTLGRLQIHDKVHLETDILAKYVQRAIAPG
ncbi:MAG: riboflavin synthase [Pirellula sp.]|jgi:riboflavin synthase|nr:riboflavin synthase [Pirellula sp.]